MFCVRARVCERVCVRVCGVCERERECECAFVRNSGPALLLRWARACVCACAFSSLASCCRPSASRLHRVCCVWCRVALAQMPARARPSAHTTSGASCCCTRRRRASVCACVPGQHLGPLRDCLCARLAVRCWPGRLRLALVLPLAGQTVCCRRPHVHRPADGVQMQSHFVSSSRFATSPRRRSSQNTNKTITSQWTRARTHTHNSRLAATRLGAGPDSTLALGLDSHVVKLGVDLFRSSRSLADHNKTQARTQQVNCKKLYSSNVKRSLQTIATK